MPYLQRLLGRLNDRFSEENIRQLVEAKEIFAPTPGGPGWLDRLDGLPRGAADPQAVAYLRTIPSGLLEMLRAVIYEDLNRGEAVLPIGWAWAPAYDWEVSAWECPGREGSRGAFTIVVRSRYPGDPLPGAERPAR